MEFLLQDDVLSIILLSFEENTAEKQNTIRSIYNHFDTSLTNASREVLIKIKSFIIFINGLYTEEDISIKSILSVLQNEVDKELEFKPQLECVEEPTILL